MKNDSLYYLAFSHCLGIGPIKFRLLLSRFSTVETAYRADQQQLIPLLGLKLTEKFCRFRCQFNPINKLKELQSKQIAIITQTDPSYPPQLLNISDPPICLYVKGDINHFQLPKTINIAIVGTRRPSTYGSQITQQFASGLAKLGLTIVSGMAIGIDTLAHQATLMVHGKTIAVLGCGVDIVYPSSNRALYEKIITHQGLIVSEFPPGHTVLKGLFVARNRIISGLSRGVLVIEGLKDSGSLITARFAAEQGKEVLAPPVPLTSALSEAPSLLIKQGATFVSRVDDILAALNLQIKTKTEIDMENNLTTDERAIIELLKLEPLILDDISRKQGKAIVVLSNTLSLLEIKGLIEKNSEGKYQIRR